MPKIHPVAALVKRNEESLPARLDHYESKCDELVQLGGLLEEIRNDREAGEAADVAAMLRDLRREVEVTRDACVRPLNQAVKSINGLLKGYQDRCEREEGRLKCLVLAHNRRVEAEVAAARPVLVDESLASVEVVATAPRSKTVSGGFGKMVETLTWGFEVVDLALIPREYLVLDEKRVGILARAERPEIPGIMWVERKSMVLR
jgi:hypothetical protein